MSETYFQHRARLIELARNEPAATVEALMSALARESEYKNIIADMATIIAKQDALLSRIIPIPR